MTEARIAHIAQQFWDAAGGPGPFPRNLEAPVLWTLPLIVAKLPRLWVRDAAEWFDRRSVPFSDGGPDRLLHGCLVAYGGRGCVLLDGADPPDELRFSLAHEVAHFLLDYHEPRQTAIRRLGGSILEVFDGVRPPTVTERVHGVLSDVTLGAHLHLMERQPDGTLGCGDIAGAEGRSDQLALELLAPAAAVARRVAFAGRPASFAASEQQVAVVLVEAFGLPQPVAAPYARWLARGWWGGPSVREWLGLAT